MKKFLRIIYFVLFIFSGWTQVFGFACVRGEQLQYRPAVGPVIEAVISHYFGWLPADWALAHWRLLDMATGLVVVGTLGVWVIVFTIAYIQVEKERKEAKKARG